MKIGIFTFHYGYNYGAILQCLGLYNTLRLMGHEVDVIDYRPLSVRSLSLWQGWGIRSQNPLYNIKKRWIDLRYGNSMRERFDSFAAKNLTFSKSCNDLDVAEVVTNYDALVVGSDQVWNQSYISATSAYFLDFTKEFHGLRISYAACCGHRNNRCDNIEQIKNALLHFNVISVRNQVTYEWVKEITDRSPEIVSDPTMLFDYTGMESSPYFPDEKYIIVYVLGNEIAGGHKSALAEIKKYYGNLSVVWICPSAHKPGSFAQWADNTVYTAGPCDWLSLLKKAEFVYTDSFHGAIFSMKYNRPFLAYYAEKSRAERLLDLAQRYAVDCAVAGSVGEALEKKCFSTAIDYKLVNNLIEQHRKKSLLFLKESFS